MPSADFTQPAIAAEPAIPLDPAAPVPPRIEAAAALPVGPSVDEEIDAHLFGTRHADRHRPVARNVDQRDRLDFSDARFDSELLPDALLASAAADAAAPLSADAELPRETAAAPEFVRRAERRSRWRSPRARGALVAAASLLSAVLLVQAANQSRDTIAARWPTLRPVLLQWCAAIECRLEAPRRIDEISVESTALTRAPGLDAFRLAVTLRNHSALPLTLPSVDLSLTDAAGQLVARRALAPQDFRAASTVLQPGAELPLQLLLDARHTRVSGYTVEIFYP